MTKSIKLSLIAVYILVAVVVYAYDSIVFAGTSNLFLFNALVILSLIYLFWLKDMEQWRYGVMGVVLASVIVLSFQNLSYEEAKASVEEYAEVIETAEKEVTPATGEASWNPFEPNWYYLFQVSLNDQQEVVVVHPRTGELFSDNEELIERLEGSRPIRVGVVGNVQLSESTLVKVYPIESKGLIANEQIPKIIDVLIVDREYNDLFTKEETKDWLVQHKLDVIFMNSTKGDLPFTILPGRDLSENYSDYNQVATTSMLYFKYEQLEEGVRYSDIIDSKEASGFSEEQLVKMLRDNRESILN